ncbi:MAG: carboxypeptidase-like regulatory domain-containing protein [Chryseolinea sp.]
MKCRSNTIVPLIIMSLASVAAFGQRTVKGIVVDSVSMKSLAGVHVRIKGTDWVAVTNGTGTFRLTTKLADTLVLTMVGYNSIELPLFFEEEDIMIRMGEKYQMLKEVTITGNRLFESPIVRSEHKKPVKMSKADAFSSPWEYFTRDQKERRKVTRLINENDRIATYIQVINDQETREDIMFDHQISEVQYYNTLAEFNKQSRSVLYSTDPEEIIASLKSYYDRIYP